MQNAECKMKVCASHTYPIIPEGNNVVILRGVRSTKPKDLRTEFRYAVDEMPGSFDSLRSLRVTALLETVASENDHLLPTDEKIRPEKIRADRDAVGKMASSKTAVTIRAVPRRSRNSHKASSRIVRGDSPTYQASMFLNSSM